MGFGSTRSFFRISRKIYILGKLSTDCAPACLEDEFRSLQEDFGVPSY